MIVNMDGTDMYIAVNMQEIVTQATAVGDSTKSMLLNSVIALAMQELVFH